MLPRRSRLVRSADFRRVHAEGRSWPNRAMVMVVRKNGLPWTRVGFSVSRRIGTAVTRNRVKRLMREAVRQRLGQVEPGCDIVFIARRGIAGLEFRDVEQSVSRLLQAAGLLSAQPRPVADKCETDVVR